MPLVGWSLVYATDQDVKAIGYVIERLVKLRNEADYQTSQSGHFADDAAARQAILDAAAMIALLDQIDADATRQAAAIASITAGS